MTRIKINKTCKSFFSKWKGLMFDKYPQNILFVNKKPRYIQIHTFFMRFPIDVYWLDINNKIIHKEKMKPWKLSKIKKSKYILETEEGKLSLDIGEKVKLIF